MVALGLLATAAQGCANGDPVLFVDRVTGSTVSLADDVQPIFTARCATSGCHTDLERTETMTLESGSLYAAGIGIVGVTSLQAPALSRVSPGKSDMSYLIHKIQGSHIAAGGSGLRMPPGGPFLSDTAILTIRKWVDAGALP